MQFILILATFTHNLLFMVCSSGVGAPKVTECDGDYTHDSRKNVLLWSMPVIDTSNRSGTMEFSIAGHEDDFFPVSVSFVSKKSFCNVTVSNHKLYYHSLTAADKLNLQPICFEKS